MRAVRDSIPMIRPNGPFNDINSECFGDYDNATAELIPAFNVIIESANIVLKSADSLREIGSFADKV